MARLPIYEQQTTPGSVRASGQEFGAGVAQAAGQLGGVVADIGESMVKREEATKGIVEFNSINDTLRQDLEALRSSDNIALGETVDKYKALTSQRVEEALGRIQGRTSFKSALRNQFMNQAAQYVQQARSEQVKAQYQLAGNYIKDLSSKLAQDVAISPEKVDDYITLFNMGVDKFEGAFDRNMVDGLRKSGTSELIRSTIMGLQETGDWRSAEMIQNRPDLKEFMGGEDGLRLALGTAKMKGQSLKEEAMIQRNADMWEGFLKRKLSEDEKRTLPVFEKIGTPMERLAALRLVRGGQQETPQEAEQLLGLTSRDAAGKTARLSELTVKVMGGQANPQEVVEFQSLAGTTHGAVLRKNAQGYDEWSANPNTPPMVTHALRMSSGLPNTADQPASLIGGPPIADVGGAPITMMMDGVPIATGTRNANGDFTAQQIPGAPELTTPAQPAPAVSQRRGPRSIFQSLSLSSGPVNAVAGATRRVLGDFGPDAGAEVLQHQTTVQNFINSAVQRLGAGDGDSRLLAAERADLIKEVGKMSTALTQPDAGEDIAYGIDVSMERMMNRALEAANDKTLAAKDSNEARRLYGELKSVRRELSVIRPKSQKELKEAFLEGRLELGQKFYMPTGEPRFFTQEDHDYLFGGKKK
jgi:hypothetical protein